MISPSETPGICLRREQAWGCFPAVQSSRGGQCTGTRTGPFQLVCMRVRDCTGTRALHSVRTTTHHPPPTTHPTSPHTTPPPPPPKTFLSNRLPFLSSFFRSSFLLSNMAVDSAPGATRRRRERRLRQFVRHEWLTVAVALAEELHHTSRGQRFTRAGEEGHEKHNALRRQKPPPPQAFFLFV